MSHNNTFMARASLFASPKDSAAVPKKKVAREAPLPTLTFPNESMSRTKTPEPIQNQPADLGPVQQLSKTPEFIHQKPKTPERVSSKARLVHVSQIQPEECDDDVEPMEVDTSVMPSPQKPSPQRGNTPCSTATTPRRKSARKSMPTPGKRLFFTSKDSENENRKANETTQLELLMATVPDDMGSHMKALITDKKEMGEYDVELIREIDEFEAVKKSRQTMLKTAMETVSARHISSIVPSQYVPLDLTFKKEEEPDQIVRRLHRSFLSNTQEAGKQRKADREALIEEENNRVLKNHIKHLEDLEERKECMEKKEKESYQDQKNALDKTMEKVDRVNNWVTSFKPIPIF